MLIIKNTHQRFGLLAVSFHWLMAIIIIGLIALGLYMTNLPIGLQKLKFYGWHKEYGLLILLLILPRLIWRMLNVTPILILVWWEKYAALAMHWLLYALMIFLPLTGWCMSSAAGVKVSFFGLFIFPEIITPDPNLKKIFARLHEYAAYCLIGAIIIHTLAALKHHFINRDDILKRML